MTKIPSAMVRTILFDDDQAARERLSSYLRSKPDFAVLAECSTACETLRAVLEHTPDLLIVDPGAPGFSSSELLPNLPAKLRPLLLFITAQHHYAAKAFDDDAVDFVLKPFTHERLALAIDRVRGAVRNKASEEQRLVEPNSISRMPLCRIVVKSGTRRIMVDLAVLEWIEAQGDYVQLHTPKGQHLVRASMTALERDLGSRKFFRIHRSIIINLEHIREIRRGSDGRLIAMMQSGIKLKVGRKYGRGFLTRLPLNRVLEEEFAPNSSRQAGQGALPTA